MDENTTVNNTEEVVAPSVEQPEVQTQAEEQTPVEETRQDDLQIPCTECDQSFGNSYEYSVHLAEAHPSEPVSNMESSRQDNEVPPVIIKTSKPVEVGVNGKVYSGTELEVPFVQAGDIKRILREAYGPEIFDIS